MRWGDFDLVAKYLFGILVHGGRYMQVDGWEGWCLAFVFSVLKW